VILKVVSFYTNDKYKRNEFLRWTSAYYDNYRIYFGLIWCLF